MMSADPTARFASMPPPRFADDDEGLAFTARLWHERRATAYPRAVAAGKLDATEADMGIRVAKAVADLWTSIDERRLAATFYDPESDWLDSNGQSGATHQEMFAALAAAADRAEQLAAFDGTSHEKRRDADSLLALAWHHRPDPDCYGAPHRLVLAKVSAMLRAEGLRRRTMALAA